MPRNEPTDQDFTEEALSHLDLVEPSSALLRRVARIPLDHAAQRNRLFWPAWNLWPSRVLIFGSLVCGLFLGAVPWDGGTTGDASSKSLPEGETSTEEASREEASTEETSTEETELDSALSIALGAEWDQTDLLLEEAL